MSEALLTLPALCYFSGYPKDFIKMSLSIVHQNMFKE